MPQVTYRIRRMSMLVFCLATFVSASTHAGLLDNLWPSGKDEQRVQEWGANPTRDLRWGEWERLRLAHSDANVRNQHPIQLAPEQIANTLATIQVRSFKESRPLFSDDEIKKFSLPISIALSKADPGQDVEFISTGQYGLTGILSPQLANVGRIFYADGRLNVILGMAHKEFLGDYLRGSRRLPEFNFGSRAKISHDVKVMGAIRGDSKVLRDDWISLEVVAGRDHANDAVIASTPATASSVVTATNASAAETLTSKVTVRLKALLQLKEQGMVSEEEYRSKRAEILKDL